ncbi:MAG: 50S ribosomal protein L10 [Bacteroidetes bacterium QS_8_68_28]|nr:MAG: 50S ribosomal protein L10 [Bacteroidetes bacterium QS_8_68_28]
MALTRDEKADIIDAISEKLEKTPTVYLTNAKGLTVAESNDLRGRFYEADVEFAVVKNTLARIAMERAGGFEELKKHLEGPTAIAFSESPNAPARAIQDFREDHGSGEEEEEDKQLRPSLKAAFVDGDLYGAGQLDVLARLKSREELLGEILSLLQSPVQDVVGALTSQGDQLAGIAQALAEREE